MLTIFKADSDRAASNCARNCATSTCQRSRVERSDSVLAAAFCSASRRRACSCCNCFWRSWMRCWARASRSATAAAQQSSRMRCRVSRASSRDACSNEVTCDACNAFCSDMLATIASAACRPARPGEAETVARFARKVLGSARDQLDDSSTSWSYMILVAKKLWGALWRRERDVHVTDYCNVYPYRIAMFGHTRQFWLSLPKPMPWHFSSALTGSGSGFASKASRSVRQRRVTPRESLSSLFPSKLAEHRYPHCSCFTTCFAN